ncbi:MAG: NUDIX hydrolase [Candidatus Shapirobacteria bacterium]|jgi:8-oxo-dGTP pyrophosphatase MutT (NUDIX family)
MKETSSGQPEMVEWRGKRYLYQWIEGGNEHLFEPRTLVHIICFDNFGNVLIQHENDEWRFPGGGSEENESLEATVTREAIEETGIVPAEIQLLGAFKVQKLSAVESPYFQLCAFCRAGERRERIPSSENAEIDEVRFVSPVEIPEYIKWGKHGAEMFDTAWSHFRSLPEMTKEIVGPH